MDTITKAKLDYLQPIEIAEGIYWIGFKDEKNGFNCNPYIIIDGNEAVVIDGGSRDEFSTVMLKILRLGVNPKNISRLIYSHSDPDLCGNLPQFEAIIDSEDLRIISQKENNVFLDYYSSKTPKLCIKDLGYEYEFKSGRKLKFIPVPYAHAPGSFMTYDIKTKTLFSGDLLGGYDDNWSLYEHFDESCYKCDPRNMCPRQGNCRITGIIKFHQSMMTSTRALNYALDQIEAIDTKLIAPQHGSLIDLGKDKKVIIKRLRTLENVGFDYYIQEKNNESNGKLRRVSG